MVSLRPCICWPSVRYESSSGTNAKTGNVLMTVRLGVIPPLKTAYSLESSASKYTTQRKIVLNFRSSIDNIKHCTCISRGTALAQWLRCCGTNQKVAGSIPAGVSGFFIDIKSFRQHYGDTAFNRNEYQEYFLRVKGGRCVRLTTLPPSWAVVTKSGNLNFLQPSGHVRALPLPLHIFQDKNVYDYKYCSQLHTHNNIRNVLTPSTHSILNT